MLLRFDKIVFFATCLNFLFGATANDYIGKKALLFCNAGSNEHSETWTLLGRVYSPKTLDSLEQRIQIMINVNQKNVVAKFWQASKPVSAVGSDYLLKLNFQGQ
jgi:hypothetical protein